MRGGPRIGRYSIRFRFDPEWLRLVAELVECRFEGLELGSQGFEADEERFDRGCE